MSAKAMRPPSISTTRCEISDAELAAAMRAAARKIGARIVRLKTGAIGLSLPGLSRKQSRRRRPSATTTERR